MPYYNCLWTVTSGLVPACEAFPPDLRHLQAEVGVIYSSKGTNGPRKATPKVQVCFLSRCSRDKVEPFTRLLALHNPSPAARSRAVHETRTALTNINRSSRLLYHQHATTLSHRPRTQRIIALTKQKEREKKKGKARYPIVLALIVLECMQLCIRLYS